MTARPHSTGRTLRNILLATIATAAIVAGISIGGFHLIIDHHQRQLEKDTQWAIQVTHTKEAKKVIEKQIRQEDPKAFTPQGIIHTYKIIDKETAHNPMGGIDSEIIINNDPTLTMSFSLEKPQGPNGPMTNGGYQESEKLGRLLHPDYYDLSKPKPYDLLNRR